MEEEQLTTCNSQAWEESGRAGLWLLLLGPSVSWRNWLIFSSGSFKGPQKWCGTDLITKHIILQKNFKVKHITFANTCSIFFLRFEDF